MGSRGASADLGKYPYGTEYKSLLKVSNIKFVQYTISPNAKTPMETKTKGRVYVTISPQGNLYAITYYDPKGKRVKQIDLTHAHSKKLPNEHTHHGYEHDENGTTALTPEEKMMVAFVRDVWNNRKRK